jgi:hypothetical protein
MYKINKASIVLLTTLLISISIILLFLFVLLLQGHWQGHCCSGQGLQDEGGRAEAQHHPVSSRTG